MIKDEQDGVKVFVITDVVYAKSSNGKSCIVPGEMGDFTSKESVVTKLSLTEIEGLPNLVADYMDETIPLQLK